MSFILIVTVAEYCFWEVQLSYENSTKGWENKSEHAENLNDGAIFYILMLSYLTSRQSKSSFEII